MPPSEGDQRTILGIRFFLGTAIQAVEKVRPGGLLVVPAAPALKDLGTNAWYREALLNADLAIADSAFMVMVWNRLQGDSIQRLSGLMYLRELLKKEVEPQQCNCSGIRAGPASADCSLGWLATQGITVPDDCVYVAPI